MRNRCHWSSSRVRPSTNDGRNLATTLWGLGFLVFTLLSSGGCGGKNVSAAAAPPPNVQIVEVIQRDVPVYHEYLATLDGYVNAQIQPQVSGYLIKQNYVEGAVVSRNQVLFKIDPRPFQAIVDQARAQVAQAEAQLGKTQLDVQRDTPLAKDKGDQLSSLRRVARS
jgi:multidrug efflux pump subunit AcrA (membrane-fusion protein)